MSKSKKPKKRSRARSPHLLRQWDYVSGKEGTCPLCRQYWSGLPRVFVSEDGVAVVNGRAFYCNDAQGRVLQVLRRSFGRWLTLEQILLQAYSDTPECDQPGDLTIVRAAAATLKAHLKMVGMTIETRKERPSSRYRLIDTERANARPKRAEKFLRWADAPL